MRRKNLTLPHPNPPHIDSGIINPEILVPIDISEEKKDLPSPILKAIPISNLLVLGYKETPEQTEAEQSEDEFKEEGEEKLESVLNQMKDANFDFDSKLIFGNNIASQIRQLIDDEEFQMILLLKPHSALNQVLIPIYDLSQINKKLSTLIYRLKTQNKIKLKFILFLDEDDDSSAELKLKNALEDQLKILQISSLNYEVLKKDDLSSKRLVKDMAEYTNGDGSLVIWSESEVQDREDSLGIIDQKASQRIKSPVIILSRDVKEKEDLTDTET